MLHLHEPFVPGLGWTALRHAGCPLVATFHANPERLAPFWATRPAAAAPVRLARRRHRLVAGGARRRGRQPSPAPTASIPPGVDLRALPPGGGAAAGRRGPARCACCSPAPSRAARASACCCAACGCSRTAPPSSRCDVCGARRAGAALRASRAAGVRRPGDAFTAACTSDAMPAPVPRAPTSSARRRSAPRPPASCCSRRWPAARAVVASRLPGYDEVVRDGVDGLLVPRRDPRALAAALRGLLDDAGLRDAARRRPARGARRYDWERVAGEIEAVYEEVAGRRRQPLPRRRRQQRELFADFHIHSHHSKDCVMPVADILERAREVGPRRGRHHRPRQRRRRPRGARARRPLRRAGHRRRGGQDERGRGDRPVPGADDPRRHDLRRDRSPPSRTQGGIVYVPHPFDRLHTIPSPAGAARQRGRHRRGRGLQLAPRLPRLQRARRARSRSATASRRRPAATRTCCPASARRCAAWTTSTARRTSSRRSPRAASCAAPEASSTCSRSSSSRPVWRRRRRATGQDDSPA